MIISDDSIKFNNNEVANTENTVTTENQEVEKSTEETPDKTETISREKELEDKYLRLLAEFENFKKRMIKEKNDHMRFALEEFTMALLPFLDNLDRAINSARTTKDINTLIEGLEISISGYLKTLERFGIKCYVPDGQAFDPAYHEALTTVIDNELEDNTVKETILKGFMLHERVIRPALVVVSKRETKQEEGS